MSFGPWSPHHKYAPGLGPEYDSVITKILRDWKKHGIGVVRDRSGKR